MITVGSVVAFVGLCVFAGSFTSTEGGRVAFVGLRIMVAGGLIVAARFLP